MLGTTCCFRRYLLPRIGGFDEEYEYFLDETDLWLSYTTTPRFKCDTGCTGEQCPWLAEFCAALVYSAAPRWRATTWS